MAIFAIFKKTVAISAISANSVAIFGVFPLKNLVSLREVRAFNMTHHAFAREFNFLSYHAMFPLLTQTCYSLTTLPNPQNSSILSLSSSRNQSKWPRLQFWNLRQTGDCDELVNIEQFNSTATAIPLAIAQVC